MIALDIRFGEGTIPELIDAEEVIHLGNDAPTCILSGLADGMTSGLPSVVFVVPLDSEGKRFVAAEMSLRLFLTAADVRFAVFCLAIGLIFGLLVGLIVGLAIGSV